MVFPQLRALTALDRGLTRPHPACMVYRYQQQRYPM